MVWCTKPFLDWLPWSWLPRGFHLISSLLILHRYVLLINQTYLQLHDVHMSAYQIFTTLIIHNFIKKEEYRHLHGAVQEYMINLKERLVSMSHLDQLLMTLCSFWIGAKLNHYQYHLIWEPGCHRASFISNSQLDFTIYHSLLSFSFQKSKKNFYQMAKSLEFFFLIWYFDFWKLMSDSSLLNLKIFKFFFFLS